MRAAERVGCNHTQQAGGVEGVAASWRKHNRQRARQRVQADGALQLSLQSRGGGCASLRRGRGGRGGEILVAALAGRGGLDWSSGGRRRPAGCWDLDLHGAQPDGEVLSTRVFMSQPLCSLPSTHWCNNRDPREWWAPAQGPGRALRPMPETHGSQGLLARLFGLRALQLKPPRRSPRVASGKAGPGAALVVPSAQRWEYKDATLRRYNDPPPARLCVL